jgi:CelD/BcsL family acetyltransferase involved in cellulose biosynthesis
MLSYEWAAACHAHLCPDSPLCVVVARVAGELVAVAPLRIDRVMGFRVLRFLGKGQSPYIGFLVSPEHREAEGAILEALGKSSGEWDMMWLQQLHEEFTGVHMRPIPKSLRGEVGDVPWKGSSYTAVDGGWDALCAEGPNWLKRVSRKVRKFEREGGTIERYFGEEALAHEEERVYVEERSWKADYGQPAELRRRVGNLYREAFVTLGKRSEIELWIARMNGEPVAYAVNFLTPDRLWLVRSAYQEQYSKLGAGAVLDIVAIEKSWEEGRREYDYLCGAEEYKTERTTAVRDMKQLLLYPPTLRGRLAFGAIIAARRNLQRSKVTRAVVNYALWIRKCPKALLFWTGVKRSRVH